MPPSTAYEEMKLSAGPSLAGPCFYSFVLETHSTSRNKWLYGASLHCYWLALGFQAVIKKLLDP